MAADMTSWRKRRGGRLEGTGCPCWEYQPLLSIPAGGRTSTARGTGRRRVGRDMLANSTDVLFWHVSIFLPENEDREEGEKCEER